MNSFEKRAIKEMITGAEDYEIELMVSEMLKEKKLEFYILMDPKQNSMVTIIGQQNIPKADYGTKNTNIIFKAKIENNIIIPDEKDDYLMRRLGYATA